MKGEKFLWKISRGENVSSLLGIAAFFAVALQIQITLFQSETYTGLRINLADLFLPPAMAYALFLLLVKKVHRPQPESNFFWPLLALMITVMTLAITRSYLAGSDNFTWAFVNKYVGILILLSYLFLGAWLAANLNHRTLIPLVSEVFCGFFVLTLILSFLALLGQSLTGVNLRLGNFAWEGFMANRNAFALLAMFCLLLIEDLRNRDPQDKNDFLLFLFWLLIPAFAVYNASRTGWIVGTILMAGILIKKPKIFIKKILPALILGTVIAYGATMIYASRDIEKNIQFKRLMAITSLGEKVKYDGDNKRMIAFEDGLELYARSNFLTGASLGRYKDFQIEKRGKFIDVIDCTPLWLLVETGLLGLLSFGGFFLLCLTESAKKGFSKLNRNAEDAGFYRAVFFFLLVFAAFSLFHEIMYTRFIWLVLGIVLQKSVREETEPEIFKLP